MKKINSFAKIKKSLGFTLAEVLVTLAIIGIVASLTIPNLIQNVKNAEIVAKVQKAQSILSQAYTSFVAEDSTMDNIFAGWNSANALNRFKAKLNVVKNCGNGQGCFPDVTYKRLSGSDLWNLNTDNTFARVVLSDGTGISLYDYDGGCIEDKSGGVGSASPLYYTCGEAYIDINGFKGSNQLGIDLFVFYITKTGIFPMGSNNDGNDCTREWGFGYGCASRVLTDRAVNY